MVNKEKFTYFLRIILVFFITTRFASVLLTRFSLYDNCVPVLDIICSTGTLAALRIPLI